MTAENQAARLLREELEKFLRDAGVPPTAGLSERLGAVVETQLEQDREAVRSVAREAFREGFLLGRVTPRFVPYSVQMWRSSKLFGRLKAPDQPTARSRSRYADYEDL